MNKVAVFGAGSQIGKNAVLLLVSLDMK